MYKEFLESPFAYVLYPITFVPSITGITRKLTRIRHLSTATVDRSGENYDSVAQLVEQYTFKVWVLGSNPSGITVLKTQKA